jgi:ribosomal protein L17
MTQEAFVKSLTTKMTPIEKIKTTLKRRVGYVEEEVLITHAKLAEMEISKERGKNDNKLEENTAAQ